jgi:hypothetical protein
MSAFKLKSPQRESVGLLLALIAALAPFRPALAIEAVTVTQGGEGGYIWHGAGFAFTPKVNLWVVALGCRPVESYGTNGVIVEMARLGGEPLASVNITTNDAIYGTVPAFIGGIHGKAISPLFLRAGSTNYITAYFYFTPTNKMWIGNVVQSNHYSFAPAIQNLGATIGTNYGLELGTALPFGATFYFLPQADSPSPQLSISLVSSNWVRLSWPTQVVASVLQSGSEPAPQGMSDVADAPTLIEGINVLIVPATDSQGFFRLSFRP